MTRALCSAEVRVGQGRAGGLAQEPVLAGRRGSRQERRTRRHGGEQHPPRTRCPVAGAVTLAAGG